MGRLTDKTDCCFLHCAETGLPIREDCPIYNNCFARRMYEKLAHYEDLEEQGRLITLPCAVGDTAYFITVNAEGECIIGSGKFSYSWLDYPRMIYATKEEAERKLEELKGE